MELYNQYSANLTGAWFMFREIKKVMGLKKEGLSDQDIKDKVLNENILQIKTINGRNKAITHTFRRINVLPNELQDILASDSIEESKLINLLAITKVDKLFREFMYEVIKDKYEKNYFFFERKDINLFFTQKIEQNEKISGWSIQSINKLKQQYTRFLLEAGVLRDAKSGELIKIYLEETFKRNLIQNGEAEFLKIFNIE